MSAIIASRPTPTGSTPRELHSAMTPSGGSSSTPRPGDSPERANKRARFTAPDAPNQASSVAASTPRDAKSVGTPKTPGGSVLMGGMPGMGSTPRASAEERVAQGMKWVKDKIGEMELVYKETILAATLITQHKTYCYKIGLGPAKVPIHMTRRLQRAWDRYEALRRHVEHYLLQCAQAAATPSKPLTSLPTPGTLPSFGLTPLPSTSPNPMGITANTLLGFDPSMPIPHTAQLEQNMSALAGSVGAIDTSVLGSNADANGMGMDMANMDFSALLGGNGDASGLDLSSLGMAELDALLQADNFDFSSMNIPDFSGGGDVSMGDFAALMPPAANETMVATDSGMGLTNAGNDQATSVADPAATGTGIQAPISINTNQAAPSADTAPPDPVSAPQAEQSAMAIPVNTDDVAVGAGMGEGLGDGMMEFDFSSLGDFGAADLGDIDLSEFEAMFAANNGSGMGDAAGNAGTSDPAASQAQGVGMITQPGQQGQVQDQQGQQQGPNLGQQPATNQTTRQSGQGSTDAAQKSVTSGGQQTDQRQFTSNAPSFVGASGQNQHQASGQGQQIAPFGGTSAQSSTSNAQYNPFSQQGGQTNNTNNAGSVASVAQVSAALQPQQSGSFVPGQIQNAQGSLPSEADVVDNVVSDTNANPSNPVPNANANANSFDLGGFDGNLEGINLEDFDFTSGMPGVEGDEFESMFAEFT